jgi:ligand-binding sensor protein/anti-sigma regulatory factor (Ser/Thr protein kinase)
MYRTSLATKDLNLKDVFNVSLLQRIQDTFAEAMGFAAVTANKAGMPLTQNSNFRRICRMIRSTEGGLARCMRSDAEGGRKAQALRRPHIYVCMGGLIDIAAPIIIEGEYLGCILCGQVIPSDSREEFVEDIISRNVSLGLPEDELRKAVEEIPSIPRERIDAAGEMLFLMANYIGEMGLANLVQLKLLQEEREKAALQAALQSAQLQMIESQINPHFLFNALGLISYTAIQEQAPQTEEISYCLADILRHSLRNVATPVTLGEEVEIISRYLAIQQTRFGARLKTQIEIDPSLRNVRVPRMILQPLVENAVIHAVEPLARPVTVQVRASRVPAGMLIEVIDDGVGMTPETVESINSRALTKRRTNRDALGLQNVARRLEGEFGDRFRIRAESRIGHGTRIMLVLPVCQNPVDVIQADLRE